MRNSNVLLIHGGAGTWDRRALKKALRSLEMIAEKSYQVLEKHTPLKAVLYALSLLEDDPNFNAGRGSNLNLFGEIEVDASIMVGETKNAGAVASVKKVKFASHLAHKVMENTPHILLTGWTANFLAKKEGLVVDEKELVTERRYRLWRKGIEYILGEMGEGPLSDDQKRMRDYLKTKMKKIIDFVTKNEEVVKMIRNKLSDSGNTVGVVAYKDGKIVAGASTGGILLKLPGRIGDTPIIGSGTYADDSLGGVSATGFGESIMVSNLSLRIAISISLEKDIRDSVAKTFNSLDPKPEAGVIAINKLGESVIAHTTKNLPAARVINGEVEIKDSWLKV